MFDNYANDVIEYPFSLEWRIPEDNLEALKDSTKKECLKSDNFSAFNFSPIPYHFEFYPNGNNSENRGKVCIFLQIPNEDRRNVCINCTFSIETSESQKYIDYIYDEEFLEYGIEICKNEDFFSKRKYIISGQCTVRVDGAHESIFASQSPLFAAMFKQMKDENDKTIEILDFTFDIVSLAVKLCYCRFLVSKISSKKAILLLKFAAAYDISILKVNLL
uniref:BTB domain-containing protein n=1 Tax=Panagrolaimus sp. ES5 TaxID=591445 RepID=A0AC34G562_9BILA